MQRALRTAVEALTPLILFPPIFVSWIDASSGHCRATVMDIIFYRNTFYILHLAPIFIFTHFLFLLVLSYSWIIGRYNLVMFLASRLVCIYVFESIVYSATHKTSV